MPNKKRGIAHLKSALLYEKRGLKSKARAHFGRAMHYGVSFVDLPHDILRSILRPIVASVLDGDDPGDLLTPLIQASKSTRHATIDTIVGSMASFVKKPEDEIHKSPLYNLYILTLDETAIKPMIELIKLRVEYNKRSDRIGTTPIQVKAVLKELRMIFISKWFLFCPYRFHDIADLLHDKETNTEIKGVCLELLDDFTDHLNKSTESTILKSPEILRQIHEIKEGRFKPAAITDDAIHDLVKRYEFRTPLVPDHRYGPLCLWKTGSVKNMRAVFKDVKWKDDEWDVRLWDTRGVDDMYRTFKACKGLLVGVEHWNVTGVVNMGSMFLDATRFDRDVSRWDTSNVKNMRKMFAGALAFNQPIGVWYTRKVENMSHMFANATAFNQPIGGWATGNVTDMSYMFANATAFNQPIGGWATGNVTNMEKMFANATAFNQPIGGWATGNVTNMERMFTGATAMDQNNASWATTA